MVHKRNFIPSIYDDAVYYFKCVVQIRCSILKNVRLNIFFYLNNKVNYKDKKKDMKRGTFVWAKMNKKYWPGIIIDHVDVGRSVFKKGSKWIFWLGDNTISELSIKHIMDFQTNFYDIFNRTEGVEWKNNVIIALRTYGSNLVVNLSDAQLINWAIKCNFDGINDYETKTELPDFVLNKLSDIMKAERCKDVYKVYKKIANSMQRITLDAIFKKKQPLESICLGCYSEDVYDKHPIVDGSLCKYCHENIFLTMYHIGNDAIHYFCFICGRVGNTFVCSNQKCGRVICVTCVDDLCNTNAQHKIRTQDKWSCFICTDRLTSINGQLQKRYEWKGNIIRTLSENSESIPEMTNNRKKLRVLSICDEIAGGFEVLDKLGIDIDLYYAYEIDESSIKIGKKHFQDRIVYIENIDNYDVKTLKRILPIDLLIGRITYRELENIDDDPDYDNDTFLTFVRILTDLKNLNGTTFFWLFECPTVIRVKHKVEMNRTFQSNATVCTNSFYSIRDNRFLWGNLPTLYNEELIYNTSEEDRTKEWKNVSINTLEKLYGYPKDYTNIAYLSDKERCEILMHTMGLKNLMELFRFMKMYYPLKSE